MVKKSRIRNRKPSKQQAEVLNYIIRFQEENDYSPSLSEIANFFKVSIPTIHQHVSYLKQKGLIRIDKYKKRSLYVYEEADALDLGPKKIAFDSLSVPVLGSANAGPAMIFAEENFSEYLRVPKRVLNKKDGVFALRVEGNSMNRAKIKGNNISEGNFVIIDSEYKNPKDKDYVLSIIDGKANLKKFRRDKKTRSMWLESESTNSNYKPIILSSEDDFMINGKIIGVIKK